MLNRWDFVLFRPCVYTSSMIVGELSFIKVRPDPSL